MSKIIQNQITLRDKPIALCYNKLRNDITTALRNMKIPLCAGDSVGTGDGILVRLF